VKKFVNKFENDLLEASYTTYGGGLNTGDAWPDGLFTKYGERRYITAAGMPRGMVQIVAPAADSIYGGDGSEIPQPDLAGGTFKRTKITPEYVKSNEVINPNELRDDTPPLAPKQRVYGRRAFGKSPNYTIPRESANFITTTPDVLVKPTTPPEGSKSGGIPATPEPGSKEAGSASGYRQLQKGGESILHGLDKLYIYKMMGEQKKILEGSLPTKVKQVKKVKGVKPPKDSKRGKEFYKHHTYHSGPHIKGKGAEHATYDFDDDDYEVDGGLQKRKDKQKRGYEPVESVNETFGCLCEACWKGYEKKGMKKMFGKMYPNCVKKESMTEDGHTDVASAKRAMKVIAEDAIDMFKTLKSMNDEGSLPSWWMNKIAISKTYMNSARDYMKNPNESVNEIFPKGAGRKISKAMQKTIEPQGNIKKVLDVAKNKQAKKIGGTLVDGTTANMMTQVWNKVNDSSKEKMNKMNTKQLINLILRLWKTMGTPRV
tara:strand:+ start:1834 stop:3291 length:1458 start_codon:yes stop_codon:yes gene_type:complete